MKLSARVSKTLQIVINTTGLDLNGGDIFKITKCTNTTTVKGKNEKNSFDEISIL
jgi:deoxycytidine triphosphate deaminase